MTTRKLFTVALVVAVFVLPLVSKVGKYEIVNVEKKNKLYIVDVKRKNDILQFVSLTKMIKGDSMKLFGDYDSNFRNFKK
jgi:hypothetical protein